MDARKGAKNPGSKLVGAVLEVYWSADKKWFPGTVEKWSPQRRKHLFRYDEGFKEWLDLMGERYKLVQPPPATDSGEAVEAAPSRPPKKRKGSSSAPKFRSAEALAEASTGVVETLGDRVERMLATATFGAFPHRKRRVYVKWKERSYLHAEWVDADLVRTGRGAQKLQKFLLSGKEDPPWAWRQSEK
eukprot:SAG31_NODE_18354_length_639_cov_0.950000_1_plen_187_part_10